MEGTISIRVSKLGAILGVHYVRTYSLRLSAYRLQKVVGSRFLRRQSGMSVGWSEVKLVRGVAAASLEINMVSS